MFTRVGLGHGWISRLPLTINESECLTNCLQMTWCGIKLIGLVDRYPSWDTPAASCCRSSVISGEVLATCFEMRVCWAWIWLKTASVKTARWTLVIVPCVNPGAWNSLISGDLWKNIGTTCDICLLAFLVIYLNARKTVASSRRVFGIFWNG